jgi:hypothetical protein
VPAQGRDSKKSIIEPQPKQERRTVKTSFGLRKNACSDMGSEILWQAAPGLDRRILDDLLNIVEYESITECRPVANHCK